MLKLTKIVMEINGTILLSDDFCLEKLFCLVVDLLFCVHIFLYFLVVSYNTYTDYV